MTYRGSWGNGDIHGNTPCILMSLVKMSKGLTYGRSELFDGDGKPLDVAVEMSERSQVLMPIIYDVWALELQNDRK